jgi:DNA primase
VIRARITIDGVVDKPDVIGAIFGQTEGLLGEDLDLRELQRTGRIGRIQIGIKSENGKSKGEIVIPVSLDKTATAILAASLETIDRVGPCTAQVTLDKLEDIRGAKRRKVVSRAISILKGWEEDISPGSEEITGAVTRASRKTIAKYGPDRLPAGPSLMDGNEIIIVEGRADILTLMRNGINNTVAVEGTHVPKSISNLTKRNNKTIIAFLDGDRGGDLILRELMQVAKIDYIARAPEGKEVEDLTRRQITKALQAKIPADQALALVSKKVSSTPRRKSQDRKDTRSKREAKSRRTKKVDSKVSTDSRKKSSYGKRPSLQKSIDDIYVAKASEIKESFKAILFDNENNPIIECGVAELAKTLEEQESVDVIVFDGVITQRLVDIAGEKKTTLLIGAAVSDIEKKPPTLRILTIDEVT